MTRTVDSLSQRWPIRQLESLSLADARPRERPVQNGVKPAASIRLKNTVCPQSEVDQHLIGPAKMARKGSHTRD